MIDPVLAYTSQALQNQFTKYKDQNLFRAFEGIWTPDLFLTKEVLYPWATKAKFQYIWNVTLNISEQPPWPLPYQGSALPRGGPSLSYKSKKPFTAKKRLAKKFLLNVFANRFDGVC